MAGEKAAALLRALAAGEPLPSAAARLEMTLPEAKGLLEKLAGRLERAAAEKPAAAPAVAPPKPGTWRLFTDGAARGNPGPAGAGAVLVSPDGQVERLGKFLGVQTNNVAEYEGLLLGLRHARVLGVTSLEILADSELMIRQLNGEYRVKAPGLLPLFEQARALVRGFPSVTARHVRREENKDADEMSNRAIDERM
jgi:ribonuclease HI